MTREDVRQDEQETRSDGQLFAADRAEAYRAKWKELQTGFVDEPRRSVEEANRLVGEVIAALSETFATQQRELEAQWGRSEEPSTEDLRVALQRYRSFFDRLLSV